MNHGPLTCPVCGSQVDCSTEGAETVTCPACGTADSVRQFQPAVDRDSAVLVTAADGGGAVIGPDLTVDDLRKLATTFGFGIVSPEVLERFADTINLMVGCVAESRACGDDRAADMIEQFVPALQSVFYATRC